MLLPLGLKSVYRCHEWLMSEVCCSDVAELLKPLQSWPGGVHPVCCTKWELCSAAGSCARQSAGLTGKTQHLEECL